MALPDRADPPRGYHGGMELHEGDPAPAIQLACETGEPFNLESLRGKKVALYFFPKANTPG